MYLNRIKYIEKVDQEIQHILKKKINGSLLPNEQERLDAWVKDNAKNKKYYDILSFCFTPKTKAEQPDREYIYTKIRKDTADFTCPTPVARNNNRQLLWRWFAAASVLLLFITTISFFISNKKNPVFLEVRVPQGTTQFVLLPDSSKVWVNAGSTIRYQEDFMQCRVVYLLGEAFFDVKKYPSSEFSVITEKIKINVKGTTFNIKSYQHQLKTEASLFSGQIELQINNTDKSVLMNPFQYAVYNATDENLTVANVSDLQDLDWRNGIYKFKDERLGDIIDRISTIYGIVIEIRNKEVKEYLFSGTFNRNEPVDNIIEKICINTDLRVKTSGKSVILY